MTERKRRVVVMGRVSTESQADEREKESLPDQVRRGRKYAEDQGWEVVDSLTEAVSGATPYKDRPAVKDLLALAAAQRVDIAIWTAADREGRGRDQEDMEEHLARFGVEVWLVEGGRRSRSSADEVLIETMRDGFARADRLRTVEKLSRGRYNSAKADRWVFGFAPPGYRKGADKRLVVDEDTAPAVRFMFEAIAAGKTPTETADLLRERFTFTPKRGGKTKPYTATTWQDVHVHNCLEKGDGYAGHGFRQEVRPRGMKGEEAEVIFISAPALISDDLLKAVRAVRRKQLRVTRPYPRKRWRYVMATRTWHEHPDGEMASMSGRKAAEDKTRRMVCSYSTLRGAKKGRSCPGFGVARNKARRTSVSAPRLEALAVLTLAEALRDEKTVAAFVKDSQERATRVAKVKDDVVSIEARLVKVAEARERLGTLYIGGGFSDDWLNSQKADLNQKEADLRERLASLRSEAATLPDMPTLDAIRQMSVGYPVLPEPTCRGMASPGSWATDPETGEDWLEEPGWLDVLASLEYEAHRVLDGEQEEPSKAMLDWLEGAAKVTDLKAVITDIGEDEPGVHFEAVVALRQPLTTPRGRRRATGAARPARSQTSQTSSTSL